MANTSNSYPGCMAMINRFTRGGRRDVPLHILALLTAIAKDMPWDDYRHLCNGWVDTISSFELDQANVLVEFAQALLTNPVTGVAARMPEPEWVELHESALRALTAGENMAQRKMAGPLPMI